MGLCTAWLMVVLDTPPDVAIEADYADVVLGPGPVNFRPAGRDIVVKGSAGLGTANMCTDKFVPMPKR